MEEKSDNDNMIESLFPKTTRREGEEPTEKQIGIAMVDVFAKDKTWSATQKPEKFLVDILFEEIPNMKRAKN